MNPYEKIIFIQNMCIVFELSMAAIMLMIVRRMYLRHREELNAIKYYVERMSHQGDVVYITRLENMKKDLIAQERFEEAEKINKYIQQEFDYFLKGK